MKTHQSSDIFMVRRIAVSVCLVSAFLPGAFAQTPATTPATTATTVDDTGARAAAFALEVLKNLADDDIPRALDALGAESALLSVPGIGVDDAISPAVGGLHRALAQLSPDDRYELLHTWTMSAAGQGEIRVLTSLVPETAPPVEFARAIGERPKKESFSVAAVGTMPGIFSSAWTMIVAADDAGNLRQLMTELEGLAAKKTKNAAYVLMLAKLRVGRSSDDDVKALLLARVGGEGDVPLPADKSDAALVAAAMQRASLGPVCEQIVERLNQFSFSQGSSPTVPFLRRLRATVILKNRSAETDPATVLYTTPELWIAADDQNRHARSSGADKAIWLTHEEHVKRLAGPGDDLLLFRYPLTGKFELKGEVTALDHGGAGLTYGGLGFDANPEFFTIREVQRTSFERRIWPFVAPTELRMFNRVNIRSDGERITFLSNLHPGWNGTAASCASCPWLGLRAFGDGRVYFRNLELVGEPGIPREVHIANSSDLRGWTATYGETVPKAVSPFQPDPTPTVATGSTDWSMAEGIIHGRIASNPEADKVAQSHLTYMRPLLDGETVSYEFFHEDGTTAVHPTLGRLAFLIETGGVRMHWLTDTSSEWTGLAADNAIVEPLNRRGPRSLTLKAADWNLVTVKLTEGKVSLSLNGEEICERPVSDTSNHHIGFYHNRNTSAVQIRNVVLTGNWPEKLSAEQLSNLVKVDGQ